MTEPESQDPVVGRAVPGQSTPDTSVNDRLDRLEQKLSDTSEKLVKTQQELDKERERATRLQRSKDRAQARLDKLQQGLLNPQPRGRPGQPQQTADADLREFANEQAKESMKLRRLMEAGLTEEDLPEDVDFATPAELDAAIRIAKLERKLADQDQPSAEETVEPEPTQPVQPSLPPVDTGGPTGIAPEVDDSSPEAMRERARLLKAKGDPTSLQQARWLVLRAAHEDPNKIIGRGSGGATREG